MERIKTDIFNSLDEIQEITSIAKVQKKHLSSADFSTIQHQISNIRNNIKTMADLAETIPIKKNNS